MTLIQQAVVIHEFHRLTSATIPQATADRWSTLCGPFSTRLPGMLRPGEINVIHRMSRDRGTGPAPRPLFEAAVWTTGNDLCLSILVAPNDGSDWARVEEALPDSTIEGPERLGAARVYLALTHTPERAPSSVPGELPDFDWTHRWSRTEQDFQLWEVSPVGADPRRLVLLARPDQERALDTFSWTPGGGDIGLLGKYLLDAVKLQRLTRQYQDGMGALADKIARTDTAVAHLLSLLSQRTVVTAASDELVRIETDLADLRSSTGGLAAELTRLQQIEQSVAAAARNIASNVPVAREGDGPVRSDLAVAADLTDRTRHSITRVRISADAADRASALNASLVQRGLSLHQQQLQLVQGSVLGAILMVLAAVQALEPDLKSFPGALKVPLIALLGSLALALPNLVVRWSRVSPRDLPLASFDYLALGLTGAGSAWFAGELVTRLVWGHSLSTSWLVVISAAGLIGFAAVARELARRRRVIARTR